MRTLFFVLFNVSELECLFFCKKENNPIHVFGSLILFLESVFPHLNLEQKLAFLLSNDDTNIIVKDYAHILYTYIEVSVYSTSVYSPT